MFQIHKAGRTILRSLLLAIFLINFYLIRTVDSVSVIYYVAGCSIFVYLGMLFYFRIPSRDEVNDKKGFVSPIDAFSLKSHQNDKELIIELKSHFWNARGIWMPIDSKVISISVEANKDGCWESIYTFETEMKELLTMRVIGSSSSKSILSYPQANEFCYQGDPLGFIYFGATVEITLPSSYKQKYLQGDPLYAKQAVLARN